MTMTSTRPTLAVGMVGYAFMGAAHSQAWRTAPRFFDLPLTPTMQVICGRDAARTAEAAERLGWTETETDWRHLVERPDVDLVDICTPGDTHAEIAIAALVAGKHVLCEKPLANTVAEAEAMTAAAERAAQDGVRAMVGFTYRRVPAIALARQLVAEGRIGEVRHVRAQYLQDWIADPEAPLSWRLDKAKAGSGALGDIGAHIVDLTQHITGEQITEVSGQLETFVKERPVATQHAGLSGSAGTERGPVTVDDAAVFIARFTGGGLGAFEATRFATGRKNSIRIEINGSAGSLAFDFEDMNVLEFFDAAEADETAGFRRIIVTEPTHPYVGAWWPPGHGLGYEHGFTHQVVDLVTALAEGTQPLPSFADGLQVQRVLAAVETSSDTRSWQEIPQ
jgi:predicted dehydrogenase